MNKPPPPDALAVTCLRAGLHRALAAGPTWWPPTAVAVAAVVWWADPYSQAMIARILALGLLAASVALLTGLAGLPTLGQVAPFAVGAYTTALLARAGTTIAIVQLACAALAATVFSAAVGLLVVRTRGTVCLMVTLAAGELTAVAASQCTALTGGTDGLAGIPAVHPVWGLPAAVTDRAVALYVLSVTVIVLAGVVAVLRSPAGMLLTGCRDNEARMRASGHPVTAYLLTAHVGAGVLAGVGGSLYVAVQRYISPADVGFDIAALTLLAVIIAGTVSIPAAILATASSSSYATSGRSPGTGPPSSGRRSSPPSIYSPTAYTDCGSRSKQAPAATQSARPGRARRPRAGWQPPGQG